MDRVYPWFNYDNWLSTIPDAPENDEQSDWEEVDRAYDEWKDGC